MHDNNSLEHKNELGSVLSELKRLTRWLERIGMACLSLTVINLGMIFSFVFVQLDLYLSIPISWSCGILSVISSVSFDRIRRKGNTMFEEISEELHWKFRHAKQPDMDIPVAKEIPEFYIRIILRSFATSTDMPLVPGKFGPLIYVILNLACTLFLRYLSGF